MFCHACGKPLNQGDVFCGNCGTKQEAAPTRQPVPASTLDTSSAPVESVTLRVSSPARKPMSKKQILTLSISGGVVVALCAAYFVARAMHGPSTPADLQKAFDKAMAQKNASTIASFIDPSEKDLLDTNVVGRFTKSLSTDVIQSYDDQLSQLVQAQNNPLDQALSQVGSTDTSESTFSLVKQTSWLGTRWYLHIPKTSFSMQGVSGDDMTYALADSTLSGSNSGPLWPSDYSLKVTAKNDYGSETEATDVNTLNTSSQSVDASQLMKNTLTIEFPDPSTTSVTVTATLNGKPLTPDSNNEVDIVPAPQNGSLSVQATILGQQVTGQQTIDAGSQQVNVNDVLNQALGQQLAQFLLTTDESWVKAWNDQKPGELTGYDPTTDTYKQNAAAIASHGEPTSETLQKVVLDPSSILVNSDNTLAVSDAEFYQDEQGNPIQNDWQYEIESTPNGWAIQNASSSWDDATTASNPIEVSP